MRGATTRRPRSRLSLRVTAQAHASNCVSVSVSPTSHCGLHGRYTSTARPLPTPDLSTSRASAPRTGCGMRCRRRIKRILTLLNARELARLLPVFKWSDRFSFLSPDILRWVIRYDTVRLFLQFSRSFFSLGPLLFTCQFL